MTTKIVRRTSGGEDWASSPGVLSKTSSASFCYMSTVQARSRIDSELDLRGHLLCVVAWWWWKDAHWHWLVIASSGLVRVYEKDRFAAKKTRFKSLSASNRNGIFQVCGPVSFPFACRGCAWSQWVCHFSVSPAPSVALICTDCDHGSERI